jgi:mitogen-activated protein kinase organizer 1
VYAEPITSVQQTRDCNAVLVSTLDCTIRLMDKGNGQLLQSYKGHSNKDYRIRSVLGMADSVVVSGSEDGKLYAWDLLDGTIIEKLEAHEGKVVSAVACNGTKKEWASAGTDGECLAEWLRDYAGTDIV